MTGDGHLNETDLGVPYIPYHHSLAVVVVEFFILVISATLCLLGNGLVIFLVASCPRLRTRGNILVANLALTDFLYGIMLIFNMYAKTHNPFPFPYWVCQLLGILLVMLLESSTWTLMAIATNRYIKVCRSSYYDSLFTRNKLLVIVVGAWMIALLNALVPIMGSGIYLYDGRITVCIFDRQEDLIILSILASLGVLLPSTVISVCYTKIYMVVRASKTRLNTHGTHGNAQGLGTNSRESLRGTLGRFIVFCCFIALWSPFAIVSVLDKFTTVPAIWHVLTGLLVGLSSAINPILYGIYNSNFREEYIRVYRRVFRISAKRAPTVTPVTSTLPA